MNSVDHREHIFKLFGFAERPLAQDQVKLHAVVKKRYYLKLPTVIFLLHQGSAQYLCEVVIDHIHFYILEVVGGG